MNFATAIDPNITMRELVEQFPGAQRAMFRKYHIGGCSSCGFSPDETLAGVCVRNENVDVEEAIEHILTSDAAERAMQIEPRSSLEEARYHNCKDREFRRPGVREHHALDDARVIAAAWRAMRADMQTASG